MLYPEIEPYDTGFLPVGDGHELYYEQSGNPEGVPMLWLHGGPGGGSLPMMRQYADPDHYRTILLDQRGAGQSRYEELLRNNTIEALTLDIDRLLDHLGVEKFVLLGVSFGSALGQFYALHNPDRLHAAILVGPCTATQEELMWQTEPGQGASMMATDHYDPVLALVPEDRKSKPVWETYYDLLMSEDPDIAHKAANTYCRWNRCIAYLDPPEDLLKAIDDKPEENLHFLQIVWHFMKHEYNPGNREKLLNGVAGLGHIPCHIIQGRYDLICPMDAAWKLHHAWPDSHLHFVPHGGHTGRDPEIAKKIVSVLNTLKSD